MAWAQSFNCRPSGCTSGAPNRRRQRAEIVGHQRIAALRQRGGQRRFSRARGTAEQHRLAVDPHRAGMQHDLLALMQQNAEHGAEDEDRNIGRAAARFRRHHDLAAGDEEEAGDVRDAHQELFAGDFPGRAGRGGFRKDGLAPARGESSPAAYAPARPRSIPAGRFRWPPKARKPDRIAPIAS